MGLPDASLHATLADDARFVPWDTAVREPHIVVDGPATASTALGLSHWRDGQTPTDLAADTSTEIVVRYLDSAAGGQPVSSVTNNHYDEDGVLAAFLLLERVTDPALRARAVAAAHAGDFHTWSEPRDAWCAIALMAMAERATTPFPEVLRALNMRAGSDPSGAITAAIIPRVRGLLDDPERYRRMWAPRWRTVEADLDLLATGAASITTVSGSNLAVVRSPHRLDALAVCPQTAAMRILHATDDGLISVEHRYETWVRFVSRTLPSRVDLAPLLAHLDRRTSAPGRWRFEGTSAPVARLTFADGAGTPIPSGLSADAVVEALLAYEAGSPANE